LTDVYHTDCQWLQCELTERSSFEWKQNPCQVEGQHDEACIAMLNNFYADGAVCLVFNVVFEDCIMNVMFINNIDVISFIIIVAVQNFISMADDDLFNLASTMPHALSMSM